MQNVKEPADARLFIGTITGNIFGLYVSTLEYSEVILFEEAVEKRYASWCFMISAIGGCV